MSVFIIPVQTTTDPFSQQVELDGLLYDLTFLWNARDNHWFLTIGREGIDQVYGIKLDHVDDLLNQYRRNENIPPGKLYIKDLDDLDRDPDGETFGNRVVLLYEEEN